MTTLLVVGCGSVGKRHGANLQALGCEIVGVDPRADRRAEFIAAVPGARGFASIAEALGAARFAGAVIASPPSVHVAQGTHCLEAGLPLLLEKPIAPDLAGAQLLAATASRLAVPVLLGYTFRWWPPIQRLHEFVREGAVGRTLRVEMHLAAHLADWHPWERYQDFFMAQAALGGGALLDESHFIDLMLWMFGWPRDVYGTVERISGLEIDTDDNVDALFRYDAGPRVSLHLDVFARPHQRRIRVYGEDGTIEWDNEANAVTVFPTGADATTISFDCQRNDMFVSEAAEFLEVLTGSRLPSCTLADGLRVLAIVEAIRTTSESGHRFVFEPLTGA